MAKRSVNLIVGSQESRSITLCLAHAGELILALGSGEIEVGRGHDGPCDLCATVEGQLVAMLTSGEPSQLRDALGVMGLPAAATEAEALRDIAISALTCLALAKLNR